MRLGAQPSRFSLFLVPKPSSPTTPSLPVCPTGLVRSFIPVPAAMSPDELACTYASLILHDDGISITAEKIATLVSSAGVQVQGYWPGLFAKLLERRSVDDLITNVGSDFDNGDLLGGGCAPVAVASMGAGGGATAAVAATPSAEEKKEEPKEESDDDMGFSLFD